MQVSISGSIFLNRYINDIFHVSKLLKFILLADNTNFFFSSNDYNDLINVVNTELIKFKTWMDYNKLSLNICKTNVMFF